MTTGDGPEPQTWVVTISDPEAGGRLAEIAVRARRASAADRMVRRAGVHKRSVRSGARPVVADLPWPEDPAVVFLRRRLGLGEEEEWHPVATDHVH